MTKKRSYHRKTKPAPAVTVNIQKGKLEEAEVPAEVKAEQPVEVPKPVDNLGICQGCSVPLKRTAYNALMDAVRCTNPRCMLYRDVTRRIHRLGRRARVNTKGQIIAIQNRVKGGKS